MTLVVGVIILALTGVGWWLVSLKLHPYKACPRCRGRRGRNRGSTSRAWGRCTACGGKGERLRRGAKG